MQSDTKLSRWIAPLVVAVVTLAAFLPVLWSGFVDLDDDLGIVENPRYRGLGWTQLSWMFTTFHMGHFQPLSWLTLALDYLAWGMNPYGYHLTNLVLHVGNALVFYFLCARLLSLSTSYPFEDWALRASAALAALVFAIHPLRVESVAWVTERRDVLSGLFFLTTLLWYLNAATAAAEDSRKRWLRLALAAYTLSLLSKAAGMTLPAVLLILDVYPLKRLGGGKGWFRRDLARIWLEKLPFALLAALAAWLAYRAQSKIGAMLSLRDYGVVDRIAQMFYNFAFYLWKSILPTKLTPLNELPWDFDPLSWIYLVSAAVVIALTCLLLVFRRRWPAGLAAWAYYIVVLLPVSGIAQSGVQLAANRYSYLSCLGLAVLIGGAVLLLWKRWISDPIMSGAFGGGAIVVVALLGALTWRQTTLWHDSERLFRYALAVNPASKVALNNYGNIFFHRNQTDQAMRLYRAALKVDPYYTYVHFNFAEALASQGKLDEAAHHYREAIRIPGPVNARISAYTGLGFLLRNQGKLDDAIELYRNALALDPEFILARIHLGEALARRGDYDEATDQFREAVKQDPKSATAQHYWGNALLRKGDLDAALEHYRRAVDIAPDHYEARTNLGSILGARNEDDAAIKEYREALRVKPDYAPAHFNLGVILGERGEAKEAADHFRKVVVADPNDAAARFYLAKYLEAEGNAEEAAAHYKKALELQPGFAEAGQALKRLSAAPKKSSRAAR